MDVRESLCLMCPLGCRIGLRVEGQAVVGPEFCHGQGLNDGRVCPRGLYATELLNHPQRVATPLVRRDGRLREAAWDVAIGELASRLKGILSASGPQCVAIVTDPKRSTEELTAVGRLARSIGTDAVSCLFEPQDPPLMLAGESADASALEEASCIAVFGDVFTTHPVLSKRIIDAKYAARGNSLFVVAPRRSNTAWFASEHVQNRPGTEAFVLASMLKAVRALGRANSKSAEWVDSVDDGELLAAAGVSRATVARMARSFVDAGKAAVVVAPPMRGIADVELVSRLAALLASAAGPDKHYVSLPSGGNSRGALEVATEESWKPASRLAADLEAGKYRALLSVGADISSAYPSSELKKALGGLELVATFSMLPGEMEDLSAVVLAGASWLESAGSSTFFDGSVERWQSVVPPSWGTLPMGDAISLLQRSLGGADESLKAASPGSLSEAAAVSPTFFPERLESVRREVVAASAQEMAVISLAASGHSGCGSDTRRMDWAAEMFPGDFVELSREDAAAEGICDGDTVVLTSGYGEAEATARITDRLQAGVVAVPEYDVKMRALFSWRAADYGWFSTAPGAARLTGKRRS
jgi:predicted molibdopterin-dependent oxidoreductase YjgC